MKINRKEKQFRKNIDNERKIWDVKSKIEGKEHTI